MLHLPLSFFALDIHYSITQGLELLVEGVGSYFRNDGVKKDQFACLHHGNMSGSPHIDERLFIILLKQNRGVIIDVQSSLLFRVEIGLNHARIFNAPIR